MDGDLSDLSTLADPFPPFGDAFKSQFENYAGGEYARYRWGEISQYNQVRNDRAKRRPLEPAEGTVESVVHVRDVLVYHEVASK